MRTAYGEMGREVLLLDMNLAKLAKSTVVGSLTRLVPRNALVVIDGPTPGLRASRN